MAATADISLEEKVPSSRVHYKVELELSGLATL